MKRILGLDLGTNSIGWALVDKENQKILGMGSRIIPMSQDILGKFDSGVSVSQTAERTDYRSVRRLRERHLLRRERLHRVLNILGFLPQHYASQIDFEKHFGQFLDETEPKIAYKPIPYTDKNEFEFLFKNTFEEMLADFQMHQPNLVSDGKKVPYDWTIYYLRKKALTQKIEKEELAWLLLNFNQKRGYYQLRGEDNDEITDKIVEFHSLKVLDVIDSGEKKGGDTWYNVHLENGWIYRRTSKTPLDWVGKVKDFIVTTDINEDGSVKTDKTGKEKRSFRAPAEDDWTLLKKKTEHDIERSEKTVGQYIYDTLLQNPHLKIKGKLVRVVERQFYKKELEEILQLQSAFHSELKSDELYNACIEELYPHNEAHSNSLRNRNFTHLFLNDIIFYQRPLKSKKSLISDCKFETRRFIKEGKWENTPLKGIAKSHPLYQEFRLWQFIQNLKIYKRNEPEDIEVTENYFKTEEDWIKLFDWLNQKKEITQTDFLKYPDFKFKKEANNYRWNYVEDKTYPCNSTFATIMAKIGKDVPVGFLTKENEIELWHILYSVEDKNDIIKALSTFAQRKGLEKGFVDALMKFRPFEKEYGAYSEKAIKKLLPLMRIGKYWNENEILNNLGTYLKNKEKLISTLSEKESRLSEGDIQNGKTINRKLREKLENFQDDLSAYKGVDHYLASYLVYGKHSEDTEVLQWKSPNDIANFLKKFKQHSLRNPIVEQVITETLRVVKDIWVNFGNGQENFFDEIHLELGREMKNPADKRRDITERINKNENTNLRLKALLAELKSEAENVIPHSPSQLELLKLFEEGVLNANEGNIPDDIAKIAKIAAPTTEELKRYKLWLQQGYISPYTKRVIPLSRLFTREYEIEHIIPQSRFFDDSLGNKVICETDINQDKGNRTAYQYMKEVGGSKKYISSLGKEITLPTLSDYEEAVKKNFGSNRGKLKKLLSEEIPEGFVERQMNDTRYISKVVKNLLSNIVRTDNEQEAISKNVIPVTGAITAQMKRDWGLEHIWNEIIAPRFQRMNELDNSEAYGKINPNTGKFLPEVPLIYQKGFSKKRIDHRHHALDALTIACITREHVNYLNSINSNRQNHSLVSKLREMEEIKINGQDKIVAKNYLKPWKTFTQDARNVLETVVVSYKQNQRVINKTMNLYQKWETDTHGDSVKKLKPQVKGDSWAIRKPMHKDTVSGLIQLKLKKIVSLSSALDDSSLIVDIELKKLIIDLFKTGKNKKTILEHFKERQNNWNNKDVSKVEVYYWDRENVASRVKVDESFNSEKISSITDTGIQKILSAHLEKYNVEKNGKIIEQPDQAFSSDGMDELNKNITTLNDGKSHQPIFKVRTYEPKGNKFNVGETGNKRTKYVEAAKGTNLFFAIYKTENDKRTYDTIPLNIVIQRLKENLPPVPEINEDGQKLLFYLSPNDLVYIPSMDEIDNINNIEFNHLTLEQVNRVYKMVSSTGSTCMFVRHDIATSIVNKKEFSSLNKMEKSIDGVMIKEHCIKLKVDRLGNLKPTP